MHGRRDSHRRSNSLVRAGSLNEPLENAGAFPRSWPGARVEAAIGEVRRSLSTTFGLLVGLDENHMGIVGCECLSCDCVTPLGARRYLRERTGSRSSSNPVEFIRSWACGHPLRRSQAALPTTSMRTRTAGAVAFIAATAASAIRASGRAGPTLARTGMARLLKGRWRSSTATRRSGKWFAPVERAGRRMRGRLFPTADAALGQMRAQL